MLKTIFLYGAIYSFNTIELVQQIADTSVDEELLMRINTPGGSVFDTWSVLTCLKDHEGAKRVKVDGRADSGGAFACLYVDKVTCYDISSFTFHRAAYDPFYEEIMTENDRKSLLERNKSLEQAMRAKLNIPKFEEITGVTLKAIFSLNDRINVTLNAKQAKQVGLVDKVEQLTPKKRAEINAHVKELEQALPPQELAAMIIAEPEVDVETDTDTNTDQDIKTSSSSKNSKMNLSELKAKHPDLYAQAVEAGVLKERDRVGALLAFQEADPEAVAKHIKNGDELTQTMTAEFGIKMMQKGALKSMKEDSPPNIETNAEVEVEVSAEEKGLAEAKAAVYAEMGRDANGKIIKKD